MFWTILQKLVRTEIIARLLTHKFVKFNSPNFKTLFSNKKYGVSAIEVNLARTFHTVPKDCVLDKNWPLY